MPANIQQSGSKRKVVVVGATSDVGRVVAQELTARGHEVRGIARSLGTSLTDRVALDRAFRDADSAYVMIPFDIQVPDLHRFERQIASNLIASIKQYEIRRVVLLSGLNAHLKMGTSLGAAEMEDRLEALKLPELVRLRAGFFNENFVKGMAFAAQAASGVFASPFRGDLPMPMIAAHDIGERAAELLDSAGWPQSIDHRAPRRGLLHVSDGDRDPGHGAGQRGDLSPCPARRRPHRHGRERDVCQLRGCADRNRRKLQPRRAMGTRSAVLAKHNTNNLRTMGR